MTPAIPHAHYFLPILPSVFHESRLSHCTRHIMAMSLSDSILVVEDDTDNREMLVAYLQLRGFTVHAAPDGEMALALADANRPRVILMNLSMPSLDGLETTRRLRANASIRDTKIVALTARALATDREAAHCAGCNFF